MSLNDFLKDRQLPVKPNEVKMFHKEEQKRLQNYIRANKLDAKCSKALVKQLNTLQKQDLEQPEEEFDVSQLKQSNQLTDKERELLTQLKASETINQQIQKYQSTEMKNNTEVEQEEIRKVLSSNLKYQVNVPSDGSCLFHAVGLKFKDRKLREELLEYVQANKDVQATIWEFTGENIADYLNRMQSDWGSEIELNILSSMLQCQIVVWNRYGSIKYGEQFGSKVEILHIQYGPGGQAHYNGVSGYE